MKADSALFALADHCGIQWRFDAAGGGTTTLDEEVIRAVLRAWGIECASNAEASRILRDLQHAAAQRVMEPVLVSRVGSASVHTIRLPSHVSPHQVEFTLALEGGDIRRVPLSSLTVGAAAGKTPGDYLIHQIDLEHTGPGSMPVGYHQGHLEGPGVEADALVVRAPRCPAAQRGWGLFMPIHALRSADDWGIGSYADLASLGEWAEAQGAAMVGSLPLYPILTQPPLDPSPYLPASKLAYNELFIDFSTVPELETAPAVRALLASDSFRRRIGQVHEAATVAYDEVALLKHEVLKMLVASLLADESGRRAAFVAFEQQHPELAAYARFRSHGEEQDYDYDTILYGQWIASEQLTLAEQKINFYADLPVGVHPEGFDPHHFPDSFVDAAHGGAPPDLFFSGGQDWSFPPLHPERIRTDGYAYLRATLRRACQHAGALRIDHVMGIHRLYWIPQGFDAAHGAYVHSHADEVRAIIALEAHRSDTVIIGEDLGTVPPEVRRDMAEDHMLRSWVMQFESTASEPLGEPPAASLASWGTHDLPRFLAYFDGDDIDRQVEDGWISAPEGVRLRNERRDWREAITDELGVATGDGQAAYAGCLEWMATSNAELVLVDLEELWGERIAHNVPGTGTERGNWVRRGTLTLEDVFADQVLTEQLGRVDSCRRLPASDVAVTVPARVGAEVPS